MQPRTNRSRHWIGAGIAFAVAAVVTWWAVPQQPRRVLAASADGDRGFVALLPGGRWALTARIGVYPVNKFNVPIRLYNVAAAKETLDLAGEGRVWAPQTEVSPDATLLTIDASAGNHTHLIDLITGKQLRTLSVFRGVYTTVRFACFSPDSRYFVYYSDTVDGGEPLSGYPKSVPIRVWCRTDDRDELLAENADNRFPEFPPIGRIQNMCGQRIGDALPFVAWESVPAIYDRAAISPDSTRVAVKVLASPLDDPKPHVEVYDLKTCKKLATLAGEQYQNGVSSLAWTPDSRQLAVADHPRRTAGSSSSEDATTRVTLWNVDADVSETVIESQGGGRVWDLRFSPDGRYLFCNKGFTPGESRNDIWDLESKPPARVGFQTGVSPHEFFSPDGRYAIKYAQQDTSLGIQLWRLGTPFDQGPVLHQYDILGPLGGEFQSAFTKDGERFMIHFPVETHVWSTATGRRINRIKDDSPMWMFSADGRSLYAAREESLKEWNVIPNPPWKWLFGLWAVEAALIALLIAAIIRRNLASGAQSGAAANHAGIR